MGYIPVRYDSRVVIYERKMFIRLATAPTTKSGWMGEHILVSCFTCSCTHHGDLVWLIMVLSSTFLSLGPASVAH